KCQRTMVFSSIASALRALASSSESALADTQPAPRIAIALRAQVITRSGAGEPDDSRALLRPIS
ncbi:MAG TPA: hypothetical protein VK638_42185, partial [Edaphobacter sp.]|nr:hypothetical protein [Edaphobacter sp.]